MKDQKAPATVNSQFLREAEAVRELLIQEKRKALGTPGTKCCPATGEELTLDEQLLQLELDELDEEHEDEIVYAIARVTLNDRLTKRDHVRLVNHRKRCKEGLDALIRGADQIEKSVFLAIACTNDRFDDNYSHTCRLMSARRRLEAVLNELPDADWPPLHVDHTFTWPPVHGSSTPGDLLRPLAPD